MLLPGLAATITILLAGFQRRTLLVAVTGISGVFLCWRGAQQSWNQRRRQDNFAPCDECADGQRGDLAAGIENCPEHSTPIYVLPY